MNQLQTVLGIDAAWTSKNPSGIALVQRGFSGWRLIDAASSYQKFLEASQDDAQVNRNQESLVSVPELLRTCEQKCGRPVDLVAVDMPLSMHPITRRRTADNLISKKFSKQHFSTHSPNASRPGKISDDLRVAYDTAGYVLCPQFIRARALIEVYPHPALLGLCKASMKIKYKYGKMRKHWSELGRDGRLAELCKVWDNVALLLDGEIAGVSKFLPAMDMTEKRASQWKGREDIIDAIVCAWVGICAIEGNASSFGNEDAAIWVPKSSVVSYI